MNTFWLLATLLTVVALLFTLPPLMIRRTGDQVDGNRLNTEVIKDQLRELDADLEAGKLDDSAYAAARHDLQRELLDDLDRDAGPARPRNTTASGRWLAVVVLVIVPVLAIMLYQQLGQQDIIEKIAQSPVRMPTTQRSVEELVAKLAERMQEHPDNIEGWIMLGRSYAAMGRYPQAVDAYARAWALDDSNAALAADYADVLATANGGRFDSLSGELLARAVKLDPTDIKALWLSGHWQFQRGDYQAAIDHWQNAAALLPPGNENIELLEDQIRQAQAQLGGVEPAAPVESANRESSGGSRIEVSIELDPALVERTRPDDTLFVFARAADGPKMPLAIVRRQVRDLPLTLVLDDSMAMTPSMNLSSFPQVVVGARVSGSGQAMARSGDLQGLTQPLTVDNAAPVSLVISEIVP